MINQLARVMSLTGIFRLCIMSGKIVTTKVMSSAAMNTP